MMQPSIPPYSILAGCSLGPPSKLAGNSFRELPDGPAKRFHHRAMGICCQSDLALERGTGRRVEGEPSYLHLRAAQVVLLIIRKSRGKGVVDATRIPEVKTSATSVQTR
jgi:hypothetical protein